MLLLPWHQAAFQDFSRQYQQARLGHAWLISGMPGIGKLQFCQYLGKWLFCRHRTDAGPCNECQDCHWFDVGTHPDWQLLLPEKKTITVGQIRELIGFAQNTSQRGTKVLVINPAEGMNLNAANALLKILEEPPEDTFLMLISHQPGQLLATLRSRCQHLKLSLPGQEEAAAWLVEQGAREPTRLLLKAQGAPLRALALMENDVLVEQEVVLAQLEAILRGDIAPVQAAKKCEKFSIQTSIEYLLDACQELLSTLQSGKALDDEELQPLLGTLQSLNVTGKSTGQGNNDLVSRLHTFYQQLMSTYKVVMAPNNANALLILEGVFGGWMHTVRSVRTAGRASGVSQG